MRSRVTSLRTPTDGADQGAIRAVVERLAAQKRQLAERVVDRSRQEILDYRTPSDHHLLEEELGVALEFVDALLVSLQSGRPVGDDHLDRAREVAARRVHQGVPLEAFLRAVRLWARVCWDAVLAVARTDLPDEREAALEIAGRVSDLADQFATAVTYAYLDEVADRGLLRRDLLDALLSARGDCDSTLRLARRLRLHLEKNYVVVVVRGEGIEIEATREPPPAARSRLDRIVEETRRKVRPQDGSLLAGMRNGDLIVLYPASEPSDLEAVREHCRELATALGNAVSIGMSGWHEGRTMIGVSYAEARDAVAIASRMGIEGRAVGLDEVLIDYMLDTSGPARRILEEVLRPLVAYDEARHAALVATLRAYLGARFNITQAASKLFVNPNTVVYRLGRIKELSGRDPHNPDDLLVLSLALKLTDLHVHH
jgi:sugar diacid utilization regulator